MMPIGLGFMESDGIPMLSQTRCGSPSMSELYFNSASPFTRWTVANALLREKFVVVDVGCQGGGHMQWDLLGGTPTSTHSMPFESSQTISHDVMHARAGTITRWHLEMKMEVANSL
jgi:hypothetical protein